MPYWITDTLAGVPAFLWIYVGLGGLWSLAILPRDDWRRPAQVIAVAFALGPALLTLWMFILGTIGASSHTITLTYPNVLIGTLALALIALIRVWRKTHEPFAPTQNDQPLLSDERLLIVLVIAALVIQWIVIAYWPFTAYDALWVYGYEGRLYALVGYIPQHIGYYPQFLPLQYAYAQLGGINDHTARAVLPFLHIGSILATYVLGSRLINRRTGIIAAAIWALYPQVGEWSRAGDLEIPLAFLFTLAAAFFLLAWRNLRRRDALIAGLLLGIGLWTKPTMGAFIFGVVLLLILDLIRVRGSLQLWLPRLRIAALTGIAALPLGGVWYLRNAMLGLPPLVFPSPFWQTLAQRSGGEFGWLLAGLIVWSLYLYFKHPHDDWRFGTAGLGLVLLALMPSILSPRRMTALEFALLAVGLVLLAITVRRIARDLWDDDLRALAAQVGWGLVLALPYFVTWFYSYSYHYRLSFAIVPLLILPMAAILARWISPIPERVGTGVLSLAYLAAIVLLAYRGIISAVYDPNQGSDYLWNDQYPDDLARYRSGNAALLNVVDGLQAWIDEHPGETLVVSAPGVDRLPFFFPLQDIRVDTAPTRLSQIDDATYFVYGKPEGVGEYENTPPLDNQVIGAFNRGDIMRRAWGMDDSIFSYDVYELHLENRWIKPQPNGIAAQNVVIGGFVRYLGYDIGGLELWPGRRVVAHLYWEVLHPPAADYTIYIHLRDQDDNLITAWDGPVARGDNGYYSTLVWEPGEYISDERVFQLPEGVAPVGKGYRIVIGMYDPVTSERLPIIVDGEVIGTDYEIENRIGILGQEPAL